MQAVVKRGGAQQVTRAYTRWLFGVLLLALIPFVGNSLVDPLWYFGGNQFGPNYPFNERVSKANLLHGKEAAFDCLIVGSSRTTLLQEKDVKGRRCFNFAVSQARFEDQVQLAAYAHKRGLRPKTIIFALDGFNFSKPLAFFQNPMPPFIASGGSPPHIVPTYLSMDAMVFSWKTLRHEAPNDRYYDETFSALALPDSGTFSPERPLRVPELVDKEPRFNQFSLGPFEWDPVLVTLRRTFPDALLLGYVPPVTAEWVSKLQLAGTLKSYLSVIYASSKNFDRVYDFSIPTRMTRNPENTYDGSHFYQNANAQVGAVLSADSSPGQSDEALQLHEISRAEYEERFESAVLDYIQEVGVVSATVGSSTISPIRPPPP